ncbi:MAG: efflux RND transporter periplasmic adaptor subunit [Gammaproteobacteria bacterium]
MHCRLILQMFAVALCGAASAQAPVRVAIVADGSIRSSIEVPGTVTSPRTATLSTAVAGMVAQLSVDAGRRVASGDTLLELDAELVELASERLRAQMRQRDVALADARRRFEEAQKVGPARGIALTTIESLRAGVAIEQAALAAARVALKEQEALLSRHALKAPFAGVISERYTELGEWLNPGDPVLDLVALTDLRFDFRVAQDYAGDVGIETPVALRLGKQSEPVAGRIDAIVPVNDPATRTFLVRVVIDEMDAVSIGEPTPTPGMSVSGQFTLQSNRTGVTVSRDAVLRFPDGRVTAWVVEGIGESPLVRERRVTTGLEFGGQIEITSGLMTGDVVVVRGNETLQEGQSVVIQDPEL